ncbi:MAG: ATP-binding protein [Sphingomonas sp.]|uniref:sensor histidine kinase n=1 Tax=Sphingomonas sp. TaxID=28214 RepID=UPI0022746AF0|nr:ATP-binding protein [Sphingomonas sp.]MCX8477375.1 ATP-binding protein [Sphingomonas sp.]
MSGERIRVSERPAIAGGTFADDRTRTTRFGNLWLEATIFLLLLCTAAAILFRSALVEHDLSIDPATAAQYAPYAYSDETSGGRSVAFLKDPHALAWTCEIRTGFAYPFCGVGLRLDQVEPDTGLDLSGFSKITLDITYKGPLKRLKIALKNRDLVGGAPVQGEDAKPIAIEIDVVQGRQTIELDLADAVVESWWASTHLNAMPRAKEPRFDNVVAIDLQTGSGEALGLHSGSVHRITLSGASFTAAQWYLLILGIWAGLTALLLVYRLVTLRRTLAARQRRHLEEARYLEMARQAAESASQAKSRFLAHMSHELRTPLNAILGYAQFLQAADLDDRQLRAASTIQESGEHLLALIGDILDHSKIEAGKLELHAASFDLRETVRTVLEMVRGRAEDKGLRFIWRIGSDVPARVVGDQKHLRQVLINLLGNAVKFTNRGEVAFALGMVARESGDVRLRFEVRDTGEGIPEDKQHLVFQAFEQVGDSAANAGGTGLGLSISQQLVERMGGRIEMTSRSGEGSRFWFELSLPLGENCLPESVADVEEAVSALPSPLETPPPEALRPLLVPAQAGNMRAIRAEAEKLIAAAPEYRAFGAHLIDLANNFQSAALLELVEKNLEDRLAA